jgi:hypothetical protein
MTYVAQGLIQPADYSNRINTLNTIWGAGGGDTGYGQAELSGVVSGDLVTANQWFGLFNTIELASLQQGSPILSMPTPTTGSLISAIGNVDTNLVTINTRRLYASANGAQYTAWTGTNSQTAASGQGPWTLTFNSQVTWNSINAARYFFNGGGRIKIETSKTSTGQLGDADWNNLASTLMGDIYITAGNTAGYSIAGQTYFGVDKVGGTGTPSVLVSNAGWYQLTPAAAFTTVYRQFSNTAPYNNNSIRVLISKSASQTQLNISVIWDNREGDPISGGTAPSGATPGTAPCTIVTYFPPSTTYISNTWGTPTIVGSVSLTFG